MEKGFPPWCRAVSICNCEHFFPGFREILSEDSDTNDTVPLLAFFFSPRYIILVLYETEEEHDERSNIDGQKL